MGGKLRPAYIFVGDEAFFRRRCREAICEHLVPADMRDFSLYEMDLAETDWWKCRPRTHSVAHGPFPGLLRSRLKSLFGRGSTTKNLRPIEEYTKTPNLTQC